MIYEDPEIAMCCHQISHFNGFQYKDLNWITMMTLLVLFNGVHYFIVLLYIDGVTIVIFKAGVIRVQNVCFIHAFDVNIENSHYKTIKMAMLYLLSSVVWSSEMQLLFICLKQPLVTKSYWMSFVMKNLVRYFYFAIHFLYTT